MYFHMQRYIDGALLGLSRRINTLGLLQERTDDLKSKVRKKYLQIWYLQYGLQDCLCIF